MGGTLTGCACVSGGSAQPDAPCVVGRAQCNSGKWSLDGYDQDVPAATMDKLRLLHGLASHVTAGVDVDDIASAVACVVLRYGACTGCLVVSLQCG